MLLKKFLGWLRGEVRQEVRSEIKDNLEELRGQIQQVFYQGTQEALEEIRAAFARPTRRELPGVEELEAQFVLPGAGRLQLEKKPGKRKNKTSPAKLKVAEPNGHARPTSAK